MKNYKARRKLVVAILGVIDLVLIFWLYLDMTQTGRQKTSGLLRVAHLEFKNNQVKRKLSTSLVWDSIITDEALFLKDSLLTLDNSGAIVKFDSGVEVELSPNSLIVIEKIKDSFSVNLLNGDIFARSADAGLKIKVKNAEIDLRRARASISAKKVSVLSGSVHVGERKIDKGESGSLSNGKVTQIKRHIFTVQKPEANEKILVKTRFSQVEFKWDRVKGAKNYMVEVSGNKSFKKSVFSKVTERDNSLHINLKEGVYFFRLRATVENKEIRSFARKFTILFEEPTRLIYPTGGEAFGFRYTKPIVRFKWSASDLQRQFVLEISKEENFEQIVYKRTVKKPESSIQIEAGRYYFRVKSFNSFRREPGVSEIRAFSVVRVEGLEAPGLFFPPASHVYFKKPGGEAKIEFSWTPVFESKGYQFLIARESDFRHVIKSKKAISTSVSSSMLPPGEYYWSVRAIDSLNKISKSGNVRKFRVVDRPLIKLLYPPDRKLFFVKKKEEKIDFRWSGHGDGGYYRLHLAGDVGFVKKKRIFKSEQEFLSFSIHRPGQYYWKINYYDENGNTVNTSVPHAFTVREYTFIGAPALIYPLEGARVEYFKNARLTFRWRKNLLAGKYHFSLFGIRGLNKRLIIKKEIAGTSLIVKTPEVGNYSWVVTAIDREGEEGSSGEWRKLRIVPEKRLRVPGDHDIRIE